MKSTVPEFHYSYVLVIALAFSAAAFYGCAASKFNSNEYRYYDESYSKVEQTVRKVLQQTNMFIYNERDKGNNHKTLHARMEDLRDNTNPAIAQLDITIKALESGFVEVYVPVPESGNIGSTVGSEQHSRFMRVLDDEGLDRATEQQAQAQGGA